MRYHIETREGGRLWGVDAFPTRERAESTIQQREAADRKYNAVLRQRYEQEVYSMVDDSECSDRIAETPGYLHLERTVTECHQEQCIECLEAGLVEPWPGLVW